MVGPSERGIAEEGETKVSKNKGFIRITKELEYNK